LNKSTCFLFPYFKVSFVDELCPSNVFTFAKHTPLANLFCIVSLPSIMLVE